MNSQQKRDFENFGALLSLWEGAYQRAVYSYLAVKTPEGPRLLFGRILFEPSRVGIVEAPFNFETEHVIAGRAITGATANDIATAIQGAEAGKMRVAGGDVSLATDSGGSFSIYFAPIYHPFLSEGPRLPSLLVRGISKHNLLSMAVDARQLDWQLRAADVPFDTLDELSSYCGLPTLGQMGDSTTLEIVARSPAWISNSSTIIGGEAVVECYAAKALSVGKLRLGYKIFRKDQQVDRASVSGDGFEWRDENDVRMGSCRIAVGEAALLQTFLSYNGNSLHQWWVTDPQKHLNPRHAIHQIFDPDLEILRKLLQKVEMDKVYNFENAVSTLLSVLGFSVINYGRIPKLQKGPDIIAISPLGHIGVVECTVGLLDENDKLAKLVQRTKLVREKLAEAGYGYLQLQPVIVTPLSKNEVAANLEAAAKHGIAVVCKEDIEELLNQVGLPPNADRLFQNAKRLVPSSGQGSLF